MSSVFNSRRTTVFTQLNNKRLVSGNKNKSKLCKSVLDGSVCRFGLHCAFAHSEAEIKRPTCLFGIACKTKHLPINYGGCRFDHSNDIIPPVVNEVAIDSIRLIDLVPIKSTDQEIYQAKNEFKIFVDDEESESEDEDDMDIVMDNKVKEELDAEGLAMLEVMKMQKY
jgi:hypothetical protein